MALTSRQCFPPCWQWVNILPAPEGQPLALGVREQDSLLCLSVMMNECVSGKNMLLRRHALAVDVCLLFSLLVIQNEQEGFASAGRGKTWLLCLSFLQETDLIVIVPWLMLWFSMVAVDLTGSKWLGTHSTVCIPVFQFSSDFSSNFHSQKSHEMDLQEKKDIRPTGKNRR